MECLVPQALQGWEFYTLLHPKPEGSKPVLLNPDSSGPKIDVLFGRPPGAQQCPSMLFILVPVGQQYNTPSSSGSAPRQGMAPSRQLPPGRARGAAPAKTPYSYEKATGNLDEKGQSIRPRLLALCPSHVYDEQAVLPDGANWGLFVGPRHRRMLLLNKTSGRIDVHLLMLFSMDAVFQRGRALIEATARLYEPFGTAEQAAALFADFDPLKAHCGLTNAVIADHVDASVDGRDDYRRLLGVWPQSFFVSNSSDNLRFLTPLEVQHHRTGRDSEFVELPLPHKLEDFPQWVIGPGAVEADHRTTLRKYRTRVIPRVHPKQSDEGWRGNMLQLLGLHSGTTSGKEDSWSQMCKKLGGCAEVTLAGSRPWQEPGKVIDARPVVVEKGDEAAAPRWVDSTRQAAPQPSGVHWRHSLDLIPGSDLSCEESPYAPTVVAPPEPMIPLPDPGSLPDDVPPAFATTTAANATGSQARS